MAMGRVMEVTTPLGDDLLFHRLFAREEVSRISELQLDLLSAKKDVNLDDVLGKSFTVKLELPDSKFRYFNGYVTRFAQAGMHGRYHAYRATLRPWLWFLTRTADCRIFQEKTVPDIVKEDLRGPQLRGLQERADRQLHQVGVLRAVPRDGLQLREPADGAGGHLLLLHARRRPSYHGAGRLCERALAVSRLRASAILRAGQSSAAGAGPHQRVVLHRARSSRACTRSTTTTSSGRAWTW